VLRVLMENAGCVVSRLRLLEEAWDGEADLRSNAIDVHVSKVRAKVDRTFDRTTITTLRGARLPAGDGSTTLPGRRLPRF
jgi:DNA-binding response OmpR family regulator